MNEHNRVIELGSLVKAVRAKNAGPFKVTIDVFTDSQSVYEHVRRVLDNAVIAQVLKVHESELQRFELTELGVIKISFPRPVVQGSVHDRDMHGAQFAWLLHELEVPAL